MEWEEKKVKLDTTSKNSVYLYTANITRWSSTFSQVFANSTTQLMTYQKLGKKKRVHFNTRVYSRKENVYVIIDNEDSVLCTPFLVNEV